MWRIVRLAHGRRRSVPQNRVLGPFLVIPNCINEMLTLVNLKTLHYADRTILLSHSKKNSESTSLVYSILFENQSR